MQSTKMNDSMRSERIEDKHRSKHAKGGEKKAIISELEEAAKSFQNSRTKILVFLVTHVDAPCSQIRFHREFRLVVPTAPAPVN